MTEKNIETQIITHQTTGMFVAVSNDMTSLLVHARTINELRDNVKAAIRDLLEYEGHLVTGVEFVEDNGVLSTGFSPSFFRFNATVANVAA